MAEFEAASRQQTLGLWPRRARREERLSAQLVEVHEAAEPAQVQRDHGAVRPALGVERADDARATGERNHGEVALGGELEHRQHLFVAVRRDHPVGGLLRTLAPAQQVGGRAAAGVAQPRLVRGAHMLAPDHCGERREVFVAERRGFKHDVFEVRGWCGLRHSAEFHRQQRAHGERQIFGERGIAPPVPSHVCGWGHGRGRACWAHGLRSF